MRLWIGIFNALVFGKASARLANVNEETTTSLRVWLTELDENFHMSNSVYARSMHLARYDYMSKAGFFKTAMQQSWYGPVIAQSIIYFKPIKAFARYQISCKIHHVDDKYFYLKQSFFVKGDLCAAGLVKCMIKKGRDTIAPKEVLAALGLGVPADASDDIKDWDTSNARLLQEYKAQKTR